MALRHKLVNLQTGRILYKQPECTLFFVNIYSWSLLLSCPPICKSESLYRNPCGLSVPSPSTILVATAAASIIMVSAATSVVMVTAAAPVIVVMVAVPAVAVLLVTAGGWFICIALVSAMVRAATAHLGWLLPVGRVILLPRRASTRISTSRLEPLHRPGEAAVHLLILLHLELPHHIAHHDLFLQIIRRWKGSLHLRRRRSIRWRIQLDLCPLAMGIRRVCRTCILRVARAAVMTAPWSELNMDSFPIQRRPIQELHGIWHGHFMFVNGKAKRFLFPIRVLWNFRFDERSCL